MLEKKEIIEKLEIENFKKFDHITVSNMGLVNLFTGDNNVGKTCFLEALTCKPRMKENIPVFSRLLELRNYKYNRNKKYNIGDTEDAQKNNILALYQKNIDSPIRIKITWSGLSSSEYLFENRVENMINTTNKKVQDFLAKHNLLNYPEINKLSKNWLLSYENGELNYMVDVTSGYYQSFFEEAINIPFVGYNYLAAGNFLEFFSEVIDSPAKKGELISKLNALFFVGITDIGNYGKSRFGTLGIATKRRSVYHSLSEYGEGFNRVLFILLQLMYTSANYFIVDEIDAGIHYLKMKDFWKEMFLLAENTGTQIFATTHSLDCINAFVDAGRENLDIKNRIKLIEIEEFTRDSGQRKHIATTYSLDDVQGNIAAEANIRGGDVWQ